MASDGSQVSSGYVLENNSGLYSVALGTWALGFNKSFTAAFAIVNKEANVKLRITGVAVSGTGGEYLDICLHKYMNKTCSGRFAGATVEEAANATFYWTNATGQQSVTVWVLDNDASGTYTATGMSYFNAAQTDTATWDTTYNVWVRDIGTPDATALATDTTSDANFVWVEIIVLAPLTGDGTAYSGTITITLQSVS